MKKCVSCNQDLPDAAAHCVFCGTAQQAKPQAPSPPPQATPDNGRTVMGYSAADVRSAVAAAPAAPVAAPSSGPAPFSQLPRPPAQAPGVVAVNAPTMMAQAPAWQPQQPQPARSPLTSPTAPPVVAQAPAHAPAQVQAAPAVMSYGGPPPVAAPAAYGGPPPVAAPAPYNAPAASDAFTAPQPARRPTPRNLEPAPLAVQPSAVPVAAPVAARPLVVAAAQPVRRATANSIPVEPNRGALRVVLIVFGVLLLATFVMPLRMSPMLFTWDVLVDSKSTLQLVTTLGLVVGGALALVFALVPMATVVRAVLALGIGLGYLGAVVALGETPVWQSLAVQFGTLTLLVGLLLRNDYTRSLAARLTITVGVGAIAAGVVAGEPGLAKAFEALGTNHTTDALFIIVPFALAVVSLIGWLGPQSSMGSKWIAWTLLLLLPLATHVLKIIDYRDPGELIANSPIVLLAWIPPVAFTAFAAFGIATMVAKKLEA